MKVNYDLTPYLKRYSLSWYQENCRIYLDEYDVEEVDYPLSFDNSFILKRFGGKE